MDRDGIKKENLLVVMYIVANGSSLIHGPEQRGQGRNGPAQTRSKRFSMGKVEKDFAKGKPIYVGVDVHKRDWVVTVLSQGEEVYHATVVPDAVAFVRLLKRFESSEVHTVYEAGPTGYWLHEELVNAGFDSMVTPPSLVPHIGGRVKTDQRDSRKLASMLAAGFLGAYMCSPPRNEPIGSC